MMEGKGTEVPKGDVYSPGKQVKKATGKGIADTPEKIVNNILWNRKLADTRIIQVKKGSTRKSKIRRWHSSFWRGLGWYIHSKKEYTDNPRKRIFGF